MWLPFPNSPLKVGSHISNLSVCPTVNFFPDFNFSAGGSTGAVGEVFKLPGAWNGKRLFIILFKLRLFSSKMNLTCSWI